MRILVVAVVLLGFAANVQAQHLARDYLRRSNQRGAERRYNASHPQGVPSYSRNYARHVERRDFFPSPTERMAVDRQIRAREWHNQQFAGSTRSAGPITTPVYGEKGEYLGTVTNTTKGTQLYRDSQGHLLSRSQLDRRGLTRYFYGSAGQFQGRTSEADSTSAMERFLEGR